MTAIKRSDGLIKHFTNSNSEIQFSFFYIDNGEHASTYSFIDEERERTEMWYPFLKEGDVIFDIGAGFLSYTLPALAAGCIVYAWSPEHEFELCKRNLAANEGFTERCHLYNYGLYSEEGYFNTDKMYFKKNNEITKERIQEVNRAAGLCGWYIPVITLDSFVTKNKSTIKKIDFVKIDTEGAEFEILKGAVKTLKKFKPKILIEYHLFKNAGLKESATPLLEELGYKVEMNMDGQGGKLPHTLYIYNEESSSK
jgi:FkbM family methyltransferase